MVSLPTPLNISCSCTECTTFLRPIPQRSPAKQPQPQPLALNPFAAEYKPVAAPWTPPPAPRRSRTTSWVDKLSLFAYPPHPYTHTNPASTPPSSSTSRSSTSSRMSISTASIRTPSPRSTYPRPKSRVVLELKCTHEGCSARIPVTSVQSLLGSALCMEHSDELRDCVREMVMASWVEKRVAMEARGSEWSRKASVSEQRCALGGYDASRGRSGTGGSRLSLAYEDWGVRV